MSVKIRLARRGAKKRPFYSIVIADSRNPRDGRFIEKVGTYNPMVPADHPQRVTIKSELVQDWLSKGAQPTDRVARILTQLGLLSNMKSSHNPEKAQPKKKAQERLKEQADREAKAAEIAQQIAAEKEKAVENPKEDISAEAQTDASV